MKSVWVVAFISQGSDFFMIYFFTKNLMLMLITIGCGVTAVQGPPAPQDLNIYFKITFFLDLILSAVCYQLSEIF